MDIWAFTQRVLSGKDQDLLGWVAILLAADKKPACKRCKEPRPGRPPVHEVPAR